MRRSVFFLTPLIPLALAACEDGPNQTFTPATGTLFNNGDTPASVTDAGDPLNSTFSGSTTTQICGGAELQEQWGAMVAQPLAPVRFMAGLDMDNGPTYPLLTVEQAELGPTFPIMNACVSQPAAKSASDGEYGATPGATPNSSDPCLYVSGSTTLNNQTQCQALGQAGLASAKAPQCAWNAIPATPAYLQANPAPTRLCQPVVLGPGGNGSDVGGSILVQWGNNGEFQMEWAVPTHKAYVLYLNPGYNGQMQWNYVTPTDKKVHQYQYEIAYPIKKDGNEYVIDWLTGPVYPGQVDELYRGIASTYAPDIYDDAPPGVTCNNTGTCLAYANAEDGTGRALFGMRPVSFYMFFNPPTLPNPSGYTVQSAYLFNIKYAPYSGIHSYFKMYDGPIDGGGYGGGAGGVLGGDAAAAEPFGDGLVGNKTPQAHCNFGMGNNFLNLLTNCIDVFQTPAGCTAGVPAPACDIVNVTAQNKVLGDLSHDDQNYTFAVVGINQNFRPVKLDVCTPALKALGTNCGTDTQDVIHDTDSPILDPTNNFANTFDSDVRSFGAIENDYFPPGSILVSITQTTGYGAPVACTAANGPTVCNPPGSTVPLNPTGGLGGPTTGYPCPGVCDTSGDANSGFCVAAAYGKELHGSGAVWREYGRLVQTDMNAQYVAANGSQYAKIWHDPSCYFNEGCLTAAGVPDPAHPTPSTCAAAGNAWSPPASFNLMEMSPPTACTTTAQCTAINPNAKSNTTVNGFGITINSCTVPFDVNTWRAAQGCTGFESWFTAAESTPSGTGQIGVPAAVAAGQAPTAGDDIWDNVGYGPYGLGGGFKPGTPQGMFCNDPGFLGYCGLSGDIQGLEGDLLGTSTSRLLQYLGGGNILSLPLEGRDRRYFFKQWSVAYAKYLTSPSVLDNGEASGGAPGANGLQVDLGAQVELGHIANQYIDLDNFIFDSFGGGASRSEFVDFDLADLNNDPVDVEQKILVLGSNLQATNYYRKLDREERALFNTLAVDKTQASWGYLNTSATSGIRQIDFWPSDGQPATPCTTNAQCAAFGTNPTAPPIVCNTNPAASDAYSGFCGYTYPKHNANPFLTNLAGSAILVNGNTSIPAVWQIPLIPNPNTSDGLPLLRVPAPAGWVDPCNPLVNLPATCNLDTDCPGVMSCTANKCVAAITPYFCATHASSDPNAAGCTGGPGGQASWFAPLNSDNATMVRRANGKPLLEGYCSAWQPNPFSLQTNAITPSALVPSAPSANPLGIAAGIQIVKTFPDEGEALVSLPTFPNPYNEDPSLNKSPTLVMVPWLPQQEGVGYPVATNGTQDVFVQTAQLDFTGQVITPTMDFFATGTNPPYGVQVEAWETQDFLGQVFLCIDGVTAANRIPLDIPGDMLYAGMYTSAETIINWLATHPNAGNACQIIVRYSPYDNYPDFITSLTGGVRLDIEQGAGYGRVVDATVFAPGTGVAVSP
ncbi:MAG: hypothetical protein ACLQVI_36800 [Polyangiaceae bacterium]